VQSEAVIGLRLPRMTAVGRSEPVMDEQMNDLTPLPTTLATER